MFQQAEVSYIQSQLLARLATVSPKAEPTLDAVGYKFLDTHFAVGGINLSATRKYRNITAGNHHVSLIIDDIETIEPWVPRGIKMHCTAVVVDGEGPMGKGEYFIITPHTTWSWGLVQPCFIDEKFVTNKIEWL
ncbi:MAG: PPOX class F420-dependent oxidoreductase [Thermomicrobiales bacterium]